MSRLKWRIDGRRMNKRKEEMLARKGKRGERRRNRGQTKE